MTEPIPVRWVQACAPSMGRATLRAAVVHGNDGPPGVFGTLSCPEHPEGGCLDVFWSARYLESLSLGAWWRLRRSWRKAAR